MASVGESSKLIMRHARSTRGARVSVLGKEILLSLLPDLRSVVLDMRVVGFIAVQRGIYIGAVLAGLLALGCGAKTAYVSEEAAEAYVSRPTKLSFSSEEGHFSAEDLRWSDWGQPVATGSGYLSRSYAGGQASETGSVTLSRPMTCNGKLYYTAATFKPSGELFTPTSPIQLRRPC